MSIKIFNKQEEWGGDKVNFVDSNNVILGFDEGQSCCEYSGLFVDDEEQKDIQDPLNHPSEIEGFNFDTAFFTEIRGNGFEEGAMVIFRVINGAEQKFIHLFNCHNGYYGHGFDLTVDGHKTMDSGI